MRDSTFADYCKNILHSAKHTRKWLRWHLASQWKISNQFLIFIVAYIILFERHFMTGITSFEYCPIYFYVHILCVCVCVFCWYRKFNVIFGYVASSDRIWRFSWNVSTMRIVKWTQIGRPAFRCQRMQRRWWLTAATTKAHIDHCIWSVCVSPAETPFKSQLARAVA